MQNASQDDGSQDYQETVMQDLDDLKEIRANFLRENRSGMYRRMRREGTLDAHLQERAEACLRETERLVSTGQASEVQARQWAIRTELLETQPD